LEEEPVDLRQLRYFAQIVESGSLSKASRQLFIAQPALSQHISKLESEVGKPLLNRSSKGVAPTDNGLALYHHARFMLRQLDQALSIARKESGAMQGMVSVGLPATTVSALGLPLVRRIRERYPNILINVVEGMSGHLGQMMRMGQLDLAVLFSSDVAPDVSIQPLLELRGDAPAQAVRAGGQDQRQRGGLGDGQAGAPRRDQRAVLGQHDEQFLFQQRLHRQVLGDVAREQHREVELA